MDHPTEHIPSYEHGELICDICGANQSSSGKKFTHPSQVWQHKKKRHPEAANQLPQADAPLPRVKTLQKKRPARKSDNIEVGPAGNTSQVKFCPCCGFHLAVVHAAMEFVNGEPLS